MRTALLITVAILPAGVPAWCQEQKPPFRLNAPQIAAEAARIDAALRAQLEAFRREAPDEPVPETRRADDAAFLRRACVDLAGRLPAATETRVFLANGAADKRARLVDRLLLESGADDWRFQRLADVLRVTDRVLGEPQQPFIDWLREQARQNIPWDDLLRAMLTAEGTLAENPAVGLLLRDGGEMKVTASELARAVLGANLHCAHCHAHPYADWTQMQVHQFAACFGVVAVTRSAGAVAAQKPPGVLGEPGQLWPYPGLTPDPLRELRPGEMLRVATNPAFAGLPLPSNYKYRDGKPGDLVAARLLPWSAREAAQREGERSDMAALAVWLTDNGNPRFAVATARRVWTWLFGPMEYAVQQTWRESAAMPVSAAASFRAQSCDSPPRILPHQWAGLDDGTALDALHRALAASLRRCGYDLREFQRVLANTEAYQNQAMEPSIDGPVPLPAPRIRRLPAEVLWDSLAGWMREERQAARSIDLPQAPEEGHPLRLFGRGSREWADESLPVISFSLARFWMSDPLVKEAAVTLGFNALGPRGLNGVNLQAETLFLTILNRPPGENERVAAVRFLRDNDPASLAWVLLNTAEFLFEL